MFYVFTTVLHFSKFKGKCRSSYVNNRFTYSLIPQLFIEVSVPSQESDWSCICVRGIHFTSLSTIFLLYLGSDANVFNIFVNFKFLGYIKTDLNLVSSTELSSLRVISH
jgi:hypothetical protein